MASVGLSPLRRDDARALSQRCSQSKRSAQQVMEAVFRGPMRVGTISQSEKTTTEVIAEPVQEAQDDVEAPRVALRRNGATRVWDRLIRAGDSRQPGIVSTVWNHASRP